ncbi:uncharacterized protein BT62DRAFT_916528 [Guyanagaster necrorhizus]|uniref:Uncharacterized protein n=1 Tax=Guyanagaster necrorhizus TaxID=856835 RepID=A0A9P8AXA1_9AGAR|nr:uncharacterized protein BT62DRAFT_916528 [Guyanagaster necrorhizus MCA 3950]KAG7451549.1 hypothetical protein BT62DRAFT_916528 [Guyanagaster necrorhizus MCA 3950]
MLVLFLLLGQSLLIELFSLLFLLKLIQSAIDSIAVRIILYFFILSSNIIETNCSRGSNWLEFFFLSTSFICATRPGFGYGFRHGLEEGSDRGRDILEGEVYASRLESVAKYTTTNLLVVLGVAISQETITDYADQACSIVLGTSIDALTKHK